MRRRPLAIGVAAVLALPLGVAGSFTIRAARREPPATREATLPSHPLPRELHRLSRSDRRGVA